MPILLAAIMFALPSENATTPPSREEIVVVGERMRRMKLVTRTDRKTGLTRCVFKRRSGDAAFDTLMCDAILTCARTVKTRPQMEACIGPRVDAYARELKTRREAARADPGR